MSGSKLIELIRQQGAVQSPRGFELASVVTPPPELRIRIDNMDLNLEGDDLIVCEHLLWHERKYSTSPTVSASSETPAGQGPHTHQLQALSIESQTVTVHSNLKAGDRVAVMALPGGQQYLIVDKVVVMGGPLS